MYVLYYVHKHLNLPEVSPAKDPFPVLPYYYLLLIGTVFTLGEPLAQRATMLGALKVM